MITVHAQRCDVKHTIINKQRTLRAQAEKVTEIAYILRDNTNPVNYQVLSKVQCYWPWYL